MNINNEADALETITILKSEPPKAQIRSLQLAIESLELNQMYYEQKGNEKGIERTGRCIEILQERKRELEAQ